MKGKKWMTLLELLIVMTILGILFVMLLKTYNRISTMVFRVQQQKEVSQEMMQISQIVQNYADRNTIDYQKYLGAEEQWTGTDWQIFTRRLVDAYGVTDVLYLSGQDGEIALYSSGDCIDPAAEYVATESWSVCSLYMDIWGTSRQLINTNKISLTKVVFKIIPFASEQQYIASQDLCTSSYLQCIHAPGFWMFFSAYSVNYGAQRATRVRVPFQQFF